MRLLLGCLLVTVAIVLALAWSRREVWSSELEPYTDAWVADKLEPYRAGGCL